MCYVSMSSSAYQVLSASVFLYCISVSEVHVVVMSVTVPSEIDCRRVTRSAQQTAYDRISSVSACVLDRRVPEP